MAPAAVLVAIAFPSFRLLYLMDEVIRPGVTIKVLGRQWFWKYELSDAIALDGGDFAEFDSYIVPRTDLLVGSARLLETDQRVLFPKGRHVRFVLGS